MAAHLKKRVYEEFTKVVQVTHHRRAARAWGEWPRAPRCGGWRGAVGEAAGLAWGLTSERCPPPWGEGLRAGVAGEEREGLAPGLGKWGLPGGKGAGSGCVRERENALLRAGRGRPGECHDCRGQRNGSEFCGSESLGCSRLLGRREVSFALGWLFGVGKARIWLCRFNSFS